MLELIQTFDQPVWAYFVGEHKKRFRWEILPIDARIVRGPPYSMIWSDDSGCGFLVKTGKTEKQTLGNAQRHLLAAAKRIGLEKSCVYEYRERYESWYDC